MSNLTKYEVLKHRHLSLLKKLEEQGIEAHYSQQEGEWQVTMPSPEITSIDVTVEGDENLRTLANLLKTDHSIGHWTPEQTRTLANLLKTDHSIGYWTPEQMRNAMLAEPAPPSTIAQLLELTAKAVDSLSATRTIIGMDFGTDEIRHAVAHAELPPSPFLTRRCPVDFGTGLNFGGAPLLKQPAPAYHWECGVRDDNGMLRMREANGDVHERTIDATLNALIVGLRHAMVSAASAKA